ncbi:MAG: hypothetical protein ACRCY3_16435 [Sphingorhabdus sp.]
MIRARPFAALSLVLIASACSAPGPRPRAVSQSANPSGVIAAEIARNRLMQEKGQWAAFRETAARDAVFFDPQPVLAQTWLKGRAEPVKAVKRQPYKALMSCDGKTGVTTGAFQHPDGSVGYFTAAWQWFDKGAIPQNAPQNYMGDGEWRWIVDHSAPLSTPREVPEFIETRVASCKGQPNAPLTAPPMGAKMKMGLSRDQSMNFTWIVQPDGSRSLDVRLWNGTGFDTVLSERVAAPGK